MSRNRRASADLHPLQQTERPALEAGSRSLTLVDLFSGTGGLTLGAALAAHYRGLATDVRLAVDLESIPLMNYQVNFPAAETKVGGVEEVFDATLGEPLSGIELSWRNRLDGVELLLGGPPCQGHSSLNNHTRRSDPKNELYLRMVRAAEVLRPNVVLIENVPGVVHDHQGVVARAVSQLGAAGYRVKHKVVNLLTFGVPQKRKRHILLAVAAGTIEPTFDLDTFFVADCPVAHDLEWAIGDLRGAIDNSDFDRPSRVSPQNLARMKWLLENDVYDLPNEFRPPCHQGDHSYVSMYGRLRWDLPAQTLTTGFGSMGQGRFMHPDSSRTITPHEAARLQGFPDFFRFESASTRVELSRMIGNAAPPQVSQVLVDRLLDAGVLGANPNVAHETWPGKSVKAS